MRLQNGNYQNRGTGLAKSSVVEARKEAVASGILEHRRQQRQGSDVASLYGINWPKVFELAEALRNGKNCESSGVQLADRSLSRRRTPDPVCRDALDAKRAFGRPSTGESVGIIRRPTLCRQQQDTSKSSRCAFSSGRCQRAAWGNLPFRSRSVFFCFMWMGQPWIRYRYSR